jgi:hypothetical protein
VTEPETRVGEPPEPVPDLPDGEAACALHRVCEACGALEDGPPQPVCGRCGAPRAG